MFKPHRYSFLILLAGMLTACSEPLADAEGGDDRLLIAAGNADMLSTKTYTHDDNDGIVRRGIYYLSYPSDDANETYSLASVDFNDAAFAEEKGKFYTHTIAPEIKWADVKKGSTRLYLDNVKQEWGTTANSVITFNAENPFVTGEMDDSNDLLWGSTPIDRNSQYIDFDLHHVMAGVRVKITVDHSEQINDQFDLSKAEVYLTGVVRKPEKYSRITGTVSIAENLAEEDYETLVLVDRLSAGNSAKPGETDPDNDSNAGGWADHVDDNGDDVFITHNFILPPQTPDADHWPELVVRFPNPTPETQEEKPYLEYFGYLPHAMETNYTDGSTNYAMNLSFLREHILEIRTKISQNPPQLVFMPVRVYKWINWGPYTLNANQNGIYSALDFLNVINYYNDDNTGMLNRYGDLRSSDNAQVWHFEIFRHITIDISGRYEAGNIMDPTEKANDFRFDLNGKYRVTVIVDENTQYVFTDGGKLHDFLAYGTIPSEESDPGQAGQP